MLVDAQLRSTRETFGQSQWLVPRLPVQLEQQWEEPRVQGAR